MDKQKFVDYYIDLTVERAKKPSPKKVYKVTLHSRGGKVIYVESLNRKRAVEAADRVCLDENRKAKR